MVRRAKAQSWRNCRFRRNTTLLHGSAGLSVLGWVAKRTILRSVSGDFAGRWSRLLSPPSLYGRQIWLSIPRWEGAAPHRQLLRCPPCHSRPMPIAVTTFRSSRSGNELVGI
jgi:hypothetical protein